MELSLIHIFLVELFVGNLLLAVPVLTVRETPVSPVAVLCQDFLVLLAPAACLTLFCLSINLIADYLRDCLDHDDGAARML